MDTKTTLFALFVVVVVTARNIIIAVMEEKATGSPGNSFAAQLYSRFMEFKKMFPKKKKQS